MVAPAVVLVVVVVLVMCLCVTGIVACRITCFFLLVVPLVIASGGVGFVVAIVRGVIVVVGDCCGGVSVVCGVLGVTNGGGVIVYLGDRLWPDCVRGVACCEWWWCRLR